MELSDIKCALTLVTRYYPIPILQIFSNEILCIHLAQAAAKLQEVKARGPEKKM